MLLLPYNDVDMHDDDDDDAHDEWWSWLLAEVDDQYEDAD